VRGGSKWMTPASARQRVTAALGSTGGCEIVRRKRGPEPRLLRSEDADAWARQQPWHARIVRRLCTGTYWVWHVRLEVAR
jgi:hypothetical protein